MPVTVPGQLFQFRDAIAALLQRQGFVTDHIPQVPVVIAELLRLALLFHTSVLEEQFALTDVFCLFYHSVFDGPELFLL